MNRSRGAVSLAARDWCASLLRARRDPSWRKLDAAWEMLLLLAEEWEERLARN